MHEATPITWYKSCCIRNVGIAFYVNGFYVGTSMKAAKEYINSNT